MVSTWEYEMITLLIIAATNIDICLQSKIYETQHCFLRTGNKCNDKFCAVGLCLYGECYQTAKLEFELGQYSNLFRGLRQCFKATPVGTGRLAFCHQFEPCSQGICIDKKCYSLACPSDITHDWCPGTSICDNKACRPAEMLWPPRSCNEHNDCPKPGKCVKNYCHELVYPREFSCGFNRPPEIEGSSIKQCKIGCFEGDGCDAVCDPKYACVGYQGDNVGQIGFCCPKSIVPYRQQDDGPVCPYGDPGPGNGFDCETTGVYHNRRDYATQKSICCPKFCTKKGEFFNGRRCISQTEMCGTSADCLGTHAKCSGGKCVWVPKRWI